MKFLLHSTLVATAAASLIACGGGSSGGGNGNNDPEPSTTSISIPVAARANGTDINCDAQLSGLSSDATNGVVKAFAIYVHDLVLINADGSEMPVTLEENDWQSGGVALLDYQDKLDSCASANSKPTNNSVAGTIDGTLAQVTGLRFTVGVPSNMNHQDTTAAASPLNRSDLFWSWQTGYKHLRMDVAPDGGVLKQDGSSSATYNIHLGSTGCVGDPQTGETVNCSADNRPTITLDVSDIANQQVVIDYAKLVENNSLLADDGGAPGCMSGPTDPECQGIFDALGMGIGENSDPNPGQTVFSIESL